MHGDVRVAASGAEEVGLQLRQLETEAQDDHKTSEANLLLDTLSQCEVSLSHKPLPYAPSHISSAHISSSYLSSSQ